MASQPGDWLWNATHLLTTACVLGPLFILCIVYRGIFQDVVESCGLLSELCKKAILFLEQELIGEIILDCPNRPSVISKVVISGRGRQEGQCLRNATGEGLKSIAGFKDGRRDLPDGPVAKTPSSQCRRPGFSPWSRNQILHATTQSSHAATKTQCSQMKK